MKKKSILIKEFHHNELVKISKVFGVPYGDLVQSMILYFKRTGINPVEAINENPAAMVKALDKRIVSFLKVQERDILKPLRTDIFEYSKEQKSQSNIINTRINSSIRWSEETSVKIDRIDENRTNRITNELSKIYAAFIKQQKALTEMSKLIDKKNKSGIVNRVKNFFE
ncbi:BfmA/BtgA family mobilization protein [Formosa algae]|uniref:DNA-binding WGR domain protein n=1 Tax=Formosa algae TaxID=225843 RepID=A0A9X1C8K4_9FLAO|nr:BfmA/BtgA family mobilization protein [Formosa algae]MBP1838638.1 putative DNA-binding WGR domain protein [Formosa algae]MDQ0335138.1 putative DNA-binding WGR domain protein [Formosa algae]OEI80389.1 hypothetical protein AST99_09285 [Formosa algae]